jgi:hypothetical protein
MVQPAPGAALITPIERMIEGLINEMERVD